MTSFSIFLLSRAKYTYSLKLLSIRHLIYIWRGTVNYNITRVSSDQSVGRTAGQNQGSKARLGVPRCSLSGTRRHEPGRWHQWVECGSSVSGQEHEVEEIGLRISCQGESKHGQCRMEALGEWASYL